MSGYAHLGATVRRIVEVAERRALESEGYNDKGGGWYAHPFANADPVAEVVAPFADLPELFAPFESLPDPADFNAPIAALDRVIGALATGDADLLPSGDDSSQPGGGASLDDAVLTGVGFSAGALEDWQGDAAYAYRDSFARPFPAVVSNQQLLAQVMREALRAEKKLWSTVRHDITLIAENTLADMEQDGSEGWGGLFQLGSAVLGLVSVAATGGAATLAFAAVSAGSGFVGAQIDPGSAGTDPVEVAANARKHVDELRRLVAVVETDIETALEKSTAAVTEYWDLMTVPEPFVGAAPDSVLSDDFLGQPG